MSLKLNLTAKSWRQAATGQSADKAAHSKETPLVKSLPRFARNETLRENRFSTRLSKVNEEDRDAKNSSVVCAYVSTVGHFNNAPVRHGLRRVLQARNEEPASFAHQDRGRAGV